VSVGDPDVGSDVARLTRWEESGGAWQVVARAPGRVTVALLRCDGGEEMDRFTSTDRDLLRLVGSRERSDRG
jgi:hypothetical protein